MAKKYRFSMENRRIRQEKSTDFPNQRALLPFVTTRVRRCQQVLSRAILLPSRPEAFASRTWPTFSGVASQWRVFPNNFAAVSVISLRSQCRPRWVLPHVPSRLRPGEIPPLQHAATRRHRTQTYAILPNYGRILSQSIVLCERIRKPSVHAGLRVLFCEMTVS